MSKLPFEIHPAAELFPMLEGEAFEEFVKDIEQNGIKEPIVIWQGKLLDGRNRSAACWRLGWNPLDYACDLESEDVDPVAYVLSANLHRRHLSTGQRAMIAAEVARLKHGGDRRSDEFKGQNCTLKQAADLLGVGERTAKEARLVLASGDEETIGAVKSGDMSVHRAAKTVAPKTEKPKIHDEPEGKPRNAGDRTQTELFAINKADVSITQLAGIPKSNKFRKQAFDRVVSWIEHQSCNDRPAAPARKRLPEVVVALNRSTSKIDDLRVLFERLEPFHKVLLREWLSQDADAPPHARRAGT